MNICFNHPGVLSLAIAVLALTTTRPAARGDVVTAPFGSSLRLTELMAAGQSAIADEDGDFPDWIELQNQTQAPLDLAGWQLSDAPDRPAKWSLPSRVLAPGEFVVIFCSEKHRTPGFGALHTNFRLDGGGETLVLSRPDGTLVQTLGFPLQYAEVAFDGADFLGTPTPGAANDRSVIPITRAPAFSVAHGMFTRSFPLELYAATPGSVVRYTLDGSEPTPASARYTGPLTIRKTTCVRAAAFSEGRRPSAVVTSTYIFPADVVRQSLRGQAPAGWPKTWGPARVDYGMDPRITQRAPYKNTIQDDLRAIPTISIVTDLANLFDPTTGLYAHPEGKGIEWERPVSIELLNAPGTDGFQLNAGLRIRGGASRGSENPKHNLRVLCRSEYGASSLEYPLFGAGGARESRKFDLRCEQLVSWHSFPDINADFLRDIYGRDTQGALGQPHKRGAFYHLYMNGQYWGLYQTDERISGEYAADTFGGGKNDYDVVKLDYDHGSTWFIDGSFGAWRRAVEIGHGGFAETEPYFRIQGLHPDGTRNKAHERLLDVDNVIDYMLAGIFIAADDSPPSFGTQNNWYSVRSRKGDFGFRFFAHDWEISMSDKFSNYVGPHPAENPFLGGGGWPIFDAAGARIAGPGDPAESEGIRPEDANPWHFWQAMRFNAEFRLRVADHAQRFFFNNGPLTKESAKARWQARMDEIDRAVVGESARWGDAQQFDGGVGPIFAAREKRAARVVQPRPGQDVDDAMDEAIIIDPGPIPKPGPGPGGGSTTTKVRPYTREDWLAAARDRGLNDFLEVRSEVVLQNLRDGGLFPSTPAPEIFARGLLYFGVPPDTGALSIYYTLDGSDPRMIGGAPSSDAREYTAPVPLGKRTTIKARALRGGEWSPLAEAEYVAGVDFGALKITELHYNPAPAPGAIGDDLEFIELTNTGTEPLLLDEMRFTAGIDYAFPSGDRPQNRPVDLLVFQPGASIVLARDAAKFALRFPGVPVAGVFTGKLSDDGEAITLETATGARVLSVSYDDEDEWPRGADGFDYSLQYIGGDPDDGASWLAGIPSPGFHAASGGGKATEVFLNEIAGLPAAPALEIASGYDRQIDVSFWVLSDGVNRIELPHGSIIAPRGFLELPSATLAGLSFAPQGGALHLIAKGVHSRNFPAVIPLPPLVFPPTTAPPRNEAIFFPSGYVHTLRYGPAFGDTAYGRHVNSDDRESFPLMPFASLGERNPEPAASPVVLSEIHYRAQPGDEFVELHNVGPSLPSPTRFRPAPVDLSGARLVGMNFTFPAGAQIAPGDYALVVAEDPATFRTRHGIDATVPIYGPAPGSLQDDGERVALEMPVTASGGAPAFLAVESARYNDRRPWPTDIATGSGRSLQRLAVPGYADEPLNWASADPSPGGAEKINAPPQVTLASPLDDALVLPPAKVQLAATASDRDGQVESVAFLVDGLVVATVENEPFTAEWTPSPGTHDVWARATDDSGATALSRIATIFVDAPEEGAGLGLYAEYFHGTELAGEHAFLRIDPQIDFEWFERDPADGAGASVSRTNFSARWTGALVPAATGAHAIQVNVTGGVRVWLDDVLIIDQWQDVGSGIPLNYGVAVDLVAGQAHPLRVEYFDNDGLASISLSWFEPSGFDSPVIPQGRLYQPGQNTYALGIAVPTALPPRRAGRSFEQKLEAVNGMRPYQWSLSAGVLPPGVNIRPDGAIVGSTMSVGIHPLYVRVTDATGEVAEKHLTLRITEATSANNPVVTITEPRARVGKGEFFARGTARSKAPLAKLSYALNGGQWHDFASAENWSVLLDSRLGLFSGENTLTIRATDIDGRESTVVEREFQRIFPAPLTVGVEGAGAVTRGFLGVSQRLVGRSYTIEATPAAGYIFERWDGAAFSDQPRLTFTMYEGAQLTAVFVPNPYLGSEGRYTAFLGEEKIAHLQRGRIDLALTSGGEFTASLDFGGRRFPLRGRFGSGSNAYFYFSDDAGLFALNVNLAFDRDARTIFVNVGRSIGDNYLESTGTASRASWHARKNPCSFAGRWTLTLANSAPDSPGDAFATLRVSPGGLARLTGELSDGTAWSTAAPLRDDALLPVYAALYGIEGSLSGPLQFLTQRGERALGQIVWAKGRPRSPFIIIDDPRPLVAPPIIIGPPIIIPPPPFGGDDEVFARTFDALGSRYTPPARGGRIVALNTARLTLTSDGTQIVKGGSLLPRHSFVLIPPGPENIVLSLDPRTGLARGTFTHASGELAELRGIADQLTHRVRGFFRTTGESGALLVEPVAQ